MTIQEQKKEKARLEKIGIDKKIFDHAVRFLITDRIKNGKEIAKKIYDNYDTPEGREQAIVSQSFASYLADYLLETKTIVEVNLVAVNVLGRIDRFSENPIEVKDKIINLYLTLISQKKDKFRFLALFLCKD